MRQPSSYGAGSLFRRYRLGPAERVLRPLCWARPLRQQFQNLPSPSFGRVDPDLLRADMVPLDHDHGSPYPQMSDHAVPSLPLHPTFRRHPPQKLLRRERLAEECTLPSHGREVAGRERFQCRNVPREVGRNRDGGIP